MRLCEVWSSAPRNARGGRASPPHQSSIPGDDFALAAMDRRRLSRHAAARRRSRIAGGGVRWRCGGGAATSALRCARRRGARTARASCRHARRPAAAGPARGPTTAIRPRCRRARLEENSGSDSAGSPCSSTTSIAVGGSSVFRVQPDGDAAESRDRQIQRHAHAADRAAHHDAFAMKIDDAPALVGRFIGGLEAHGQERKGRAADRAARPGSDPAGFHLTPRKTRSRRAVAARLPRQCQSAVAIRLKSLVNGSYRPSECVA